MGLQPAGENGTYFQTFVIRERTLDPASRLIVGDSVLRPTADFKVFPRPQRTATHRAHPGNLRWDSRGY